MGVRKVEDSYWSKFYNLVMAWTITDTDSEAAVLAELGQQKLTSDTR